MRGVEVLLRLFALTRRMHNKAWIADDNSPSSAGAMLAMPISMPQRPIFATSTCCSWDLRFSKPLRYSKPSGLVRKPNQSKRSVQPKHGMPIPSKEATPNPTSF